MKYNTWETAEGLSKIWKPSLSLGISNKLKPFKYSSKLLGCRKEAGTQGQLATSLVWKKVKSAGCRHCGCSGVVACVTAGIPAAWLSKWQVRGTRHHSWCCSPCLRLSSCFNGGTCIDGINSFSCLCPVSFTGPFCVHEINECNSHPCLNEGTCVDGLGTYRCICPLGYTGKNCQVIKSNNIRR